MDRIVSSTLPRLLSRSAQLQFPSFFARNVPRTGALGCQQNRARHGFQVPHHSGSPELRGVEILRNPHTNKVREGDITSSVDIIMTYYVVC